MDILVIDALKSGKTRDLTEHALNMGADVRLTVSDNPASLNVPDGIAGVVVFDDNQNNVTDWIAKIRERTRYLSVPLVAVAGKPGREIHAKLLAAGANAVCDVDSTSSTILSEIRNRCIVKPVISDIREKLLNPFTTATIQTFQEMAGLTVTVKSVYEKSGYKMFGDISAVIGLMANVEGSMVLSFPDHTAADVVKQILRGVMDQPSQDAIRDCVGEIANVIAGQVRGQLEGSPYHFALSTPTIVAGVGHEIRHKAGIPCQVVAFSSELGDFGLQVCMAI